MALCIRYSRVGAMSTQHSWQSSPFSSSVRWTSHSSSTSKTVLRCNTHAKIKSNVSSNIRCVAVREREPVFRHDDFVTQWKKMVEVNSGSQTVGKVQKLPFRDGFVFTFRVCGGVECKKRPQKSNFQRILSRPMSCQLFLNSKNKKIQTFLKIFYGSWSNRYTFGCMPL